MPATEGAERVSRRGTVEGYNSGHAGERVEQRGDVGEADDRLRPARESREVDSGENPGDAVAAPDAPYCVHVVRRERGIEIGEALVIVTGEVPVAATGV